MYTLYGIATCGTCKKARSFLKEEGIEATWTDLRDTPPSRAQVSRWVEAFGAKALRNTSGGSFRALGPERETWSDAEWLDAYVRDPMLIKRPLLEQNGKPVHLGFRTPWDLS